MKRLQPWLLLLTGLLYGVSPIDLIPDVIPVLGLVDDALIVPIFLVLAGFQFRHNRRKQRLLNSK